MRKLKLQTHISLDGYICGPNNEMDWITWEPNPGGWKYVNGLIDTSDTILLGRKMTAEFMRYWTEVAADPSAQRHEFAKKMVNTPKVVFTKTLEDHNWVNTTLAKGELVEEVTRLKNREGKDLLLYGGATLDAAMISAGLIDEYHLFINPAAIGTGKPIFKQRTNLKLIKSFALENGITIQHYQPR